jgi:hypothetical protein
VSWLRQLVSGLSPWRAEFMPGSVHVGFVVDKMALGHDFLQVFGLSLAISFHHGSPYSYITWGINNRSTGGLNSKTLSHPIDMNNHHQGVAVCLVVKWPECEVHHSHNFILWYVHTAAN